MGIEDRALRERTARRRLITSTARELAEREGWDAVTTRRLASEIEYSQPVLYKHFASMEAIAEAVALGGFDELAAALRAARAGEATPEALLSRAAHAYCGFATTNPALYDAMFTRLTRLRFGGTPDTPTPMASALSELRGIVATFAEEPDVESTTEVVWAALHGLATLARSGRLRPGAGDDRIRLLVAAFRPGPVAPGDDETAPDTQEQAPR